MEEEALVIVIAQKSAWIKDKPKLEGAEKFANSISNPKKERKRTSTSSLHDRAISRVFPLFTRDSERLGARWKRFIKILAHLVPGRIPRADLPREPFAGETRFLSARHRRGDKSRPPWARSTRGTTSGEKGIGGEDRRYSQNLITIGSSAQRGGAAWM